MMNRTVKRFMIPLVLLVLLFCFLMFSSDEYTDFSGAVSAIFTFIIFPLFLITLVWSVIGMINDHKLRAQGIEPSNILFPTVAKTRAAISKDREEAATLPDDLKKRRTKFRIWGSLLVILGLLALCCGLVIIGTLIIIGGVALFISSTPKTYSDSVDGINMLACPPEYTLDRIYEDFKEYHTVFGSVYRGTTFPNCPALFWKSAESDWLFYIYKPKGKNILYIGTGADIGCKQLTEPLYPAEQPVTNDFQGALCWNLENHNFAADLSDVIRHYLETGEILPMPEYQKGNIYFFEENFKLTGQRFVLYNGSRDPVYTIEGTYPLKTIKIYDQNENVIFRVSKELVHALPHYLFYQDGQLVGEFAKDFDLVRDAFSMETREGLLEMKEVNLLLGSNYILTLNGKRIGTIAERMNLTLENLVFDNMVITVYDQTQLPLITALGVMAARETARDEAND